MSNTHKIDSVLHCKASLELEESTRKELEIQTNEEETDEAVKELKAKAKKSNS